jgi:hypothetical protein
MDERIPLDPKKNLARMQEQVIPAWKTKVARLENEEAAVMEKIRKAREEGNTFYASILEKGQLTKVQTNLEELRNRLEWAYDRVENIIDHINSQGDLKVSIGELVND